MCTITGAVVVPQQCSGGFAGVHGPEEQEMTRGPLTSAEVFHDVYESEQCVHCKTVCPPLGFLPGESIHNIEQYVDGQLIESFIEGVLVIGGLFNTLSDKPYPENCAQQSSLEETNTFQQLPVEPTPPQSQPPDTTLCQPQENKPPSPPPPPLCAKYRDGEETDLNRWPWLDPPGIARQSVFSWRVGGV